MAKQPTKTKKTTKTKKASSLQQGLFAQRDNLRIFVAVLIFAVTGFGFLLYSSAQAPFPVDANKVILAYQKVAPPIVSRTEADPEPIYESSSSSYAVMGDGQIICDDGNASGDVVTGNLNRGQLKQLYKEIEDLDLGTVPNETGADQNGVVSSYEGYLVNSKNATRGYAVYEGGAKPDKLARMEEKIKKRCDQATRKQQRQDLKEVDPPAITAQATEQRRVIDKVASALSVKVSAAPSSTKGTADPGVADYQFNRINQERARYGQAALRRENCLNNYAYNQAKAIMERGYLFHSNLTQGAATYCPGIYWTKLGENVGRGYNNESLFQKFMSSPTHRANILDGQFNRGGVGAYRAHNGEYWVAQEFGRW